MPTIRSLVALTTLAIGSTAWAGQPLDTAITYQGLLTAEGVAAESIVDLRFRLYDAESGGNLIGAELEILNHNLEGGLLTASLDFGPESFNERQRWLEIDVKGPADAGYTTLAPRQPITIAPAAGVALKPWTIADTHISYNDGAVGIGITNPFASLHLTNGPLAPDPAVFLNEDFIIEDNDAILSLLSNANGVAGSGLVMKEITPEGLLANQWSIYRGTTFVDAPLLLTFGTDANYITNPTIFTFHTDGRLTTAPRTETLLFSAADATLIGNMKIAIGLGAPIYTLQTITNSNGIAVFPFRLPAGSQITEISATVSDLTPNAFVEVILIEHPIGTELAFQRESASTTFAYQTGLVTISETLSPPRTILPDHTYALEVRILGSLTNKVAEVIDAKITYTTTTID